MGNFPNRLKKRERKYQRSYESSSYEETDNEKKYYVYPKNKKPRKNKKTYYDNVDGDYDDVDDNIDNHTDDKELLFS